jgi:hypothetical protein
MSIKTGFLFLRNSICICISLQILYRDIKSAAIMEFSGAKSLYAEGQMCWDQECMYNVLESIHSFDRILT